MKKKIFVSVILGWFIKRKNNSTMPPATVMTLRISWFRWIVIVSCWFWSWCWGNISLWGWCFSYIWRWCFCCFANRTTLIWSSVKCICWTLYVIRTVFSYTNTWHMTCFFFVSLFFCESSHGCHPTTPWPLKHTKMKKKKQYFMCFFCLY